MNYSKFFSIVILFCLATALTLVSCKPSVSYPSPLQGLKIDDVTLESSVTQKNISISNRLTDVAATIKDVNTGEEYPSWISLTIETSRIVLKLKENVTTNDREALIHLYYDGTRTDLEDIGATTDFHVKQKRFSKFDSLKIGNIEMPYTLCDTTITTTPLSNVKIEVTDLDNGSTNPQWCVIKFVSEGIFIILTENQTTADRHAYVTLTPKTTSDTEEFDVARYSFRITQKHNTTTSE